MMPTRRDFLGKSALVVLTTGVGVVSGSLLLAGCGSGGDDDDGGSRSVAQTSGGDAVGTETAGRLVGESIYPVLAIRNYQERNALLFGTRDAGGAPKSLYQSIHWDGTDTTQATRIIYDSAGYPAQLIDETTGAFLALFWNTTTGIVDIQSYNGGAVYQGGIRATIASGAVTNAVALESEPTRAVPGSGSAFSRATSTDELEAQQQAVSVAAIAVLQLLLSAGTTSSILTPPLLALLVLSNGQSQRYGRTLDLWYRLVLQTLVASTLTPTLLTLGIGRGYDNLEDYYGYSLFRVIYRLYFFNVVRHLYLTSG